MRITVEFDSMDEFEAFRVSGKKTRSKKEEAEEAAPVAEPTPPPMTVTPTAAPQPIAPVPAPPPVPMHGFPGGNGGQAPTSDPRIAAILARIDGAISSGQPTDNIVNWFRQQIGPEAANATLDQLRQVFIPRLTEVQLNQLAPLLGFQR